jgi:site-specific DNA-cytosine methylase
MNVLSLFDGMSCGMIALERAGIKVDHYYASEIDKHAIRVSEANYPDIIRLAVRGSDLRNRFSEPTTCQLTALYLPWQIEELISKIRNGGAS